MKPTQYLYTRAGPDSYIVGFYRPDGAWETESTHAESEQAARRVHFLNGGNGDAPRCLTQAEREAAWRKAVQW